MIIFFTCAESLCFTTFAWSSVKARVSGRAFCFRSHQTETVFTDDEIGSAPLLCKKSYNELRSAYDWTAQSPDLVWILYVLTRIVLGGKGSHLGPPQN